MIHELSAESDDWLREQRHRAINMLLGLVVVLGPLSLIPGLESLFRGEGLTPMSPVYLIANILALVLFLWRRLGDRWRALGLLLMTYGFATFFLFSGWLAGGGRLFLLAWIVMAALLLSTRTAFVAAGVSLLTFIAYGIAFNQEWITLRDLPDPTSASPILVEGVGFSLTIGVMAMIPWFFSRAIAAASQANREAERAQALLAERAAQLEAANQELEAFAYSVSHDLRAPLRAMDGFSRILLDDYGPQLVPEAQRYLGMVRENAQHMARLIDDLLAFSRLGRRELRKQAVRPRDLVEEVLAELRAEQGAQQIEVTIHDLPACQADPALLRQVYANLLSNAYKFTQERQVARIEVGALHQEEGPVYFVRDNGVGFDMRYADKLFGVFQRLHGAEEYEGTGVGLAIAQRIVHRHGGRVWAEAEVNKGATFHFTLGEGQRS
jgi:signal transduction histidine kinase